MLYQRIARVSATVRVHLDDVPLLPFFFFDVTAATEIYTLSLHDALPILLAINALGLMLLDYLSFAELVPLCEEAGRWSLDRKSTRLNSSHVSISYAVFCLKKKNTRSATYLGSRPLSSRTRSPHAGCGFIT